MASLLRQIVAGPRSRHPEAGLDLCYVTDFIIATSGPSGTYPQRAYRNPLDQLVKFLDHKHGENWAIWEFRAEGTGYPDEEVYGRVWHYPWPDHHPPPFGLVPLIMASMRNWLNENTPNKDPKSGKIEDMGKEIGIGKKDKGNGNGRVVVVHCKAGKGRSGTMACSYLISECGWTPSEAIARFTERRMRPGFGQGVSIPSQLRWVGYVEQWAKSGKIYMERQIEILEVHVWGLRDGVKVQIEGFVDEGKTIKLFHVFTKKERVVVEDSVLGGGGITNMISEMAGFQNQDKVKPNSLSTDQISTPRKSKTTESGSSSSSSSSKNSNVDAAGDETGGGAVIFKPSTRVILPTSDINIDFERRNKARMGYTFVTAVAHVWFNTFFEGHGPENHGKPDDSGVFEIEWDKMDGIKGSSRKGTRALDRLAVVWKAYIPESGSGKAAAEGTIIHEPGPDSPVPQMKPADWKGGNDVSPGGSHKDLGLRTENPASADVSKASSLKSNEGKDSDHNSDEGVKPSGPAGHEDLHVNTGDSSQPKTSGSEPSLAALNLGLDTASATTAQRGTEIQISSPDDPTIGKAATMPTSLLPGGIPESEMKTAHPHNLGHLQNVKNVIDS